MGAAIIVCEQRAARDVVRILAPTPDNTFRRDADRRRRCSLAFTGRARRTYTYCTMGRPVGESVGHFLMMVYHLDP